MECKQCKEYEKIIATLQTKNRFYKKKLNDVSKAINKNIPGEHCETKKRKKWMKYCETVKKGG